MKLCDYVLDCVADRRGTVTAGTYNSYVYAAQRVPDVDVDDVDVGVLNAWLVHMRDVGYSRSSIKQTMTALQIAYPDWRLKLPRRCLKSSVTAFTPFQRDSFLRSASGTIYGDFWRFLFDTGIRFCEICELRFKDVDLRRGEIRITRDYYRGAIQGCKTAASVRVIPLPAHWRMWFRRSSAGQLPAALVFTNSRGGRIQYRTALDAWHNVCDRAGLQWCGIHVARHTYATDMLRAGIDVKIISALLGHADSATTRDMYCDVTADMMSDAVTTLFARRA